VAPTQPADSATALLLSNRTATPHGARAIVWKSGRPRGWTPFNLRRPGGGFPTACAILGIQIGLEAISIATLQ